MACVLPHRHRGDARSVTQTVIDRWGIEQANHDLKEVEGIGL